MSHDLEGLLTVERDVISVVSTSAAEQPLARIYRRVFAAGLLLGAIAASTFLRGFLPLQRSTRGGVATSALRDAVDEALAATWTPAATPWGPIPPAPAPSLLVFGAVEEVPAVEQAVSDAPLEAPPPPRVTPGGATFSAAPAFAAGVAQTASPLAAPPSPTEAPAQAPGLQASSPLCWADPADSMTMYMYRAQGPYDYEFSNVNAADLPGVLLYLHHEVVRHCPRKSGITRILRKKVTIKNSQMRRGPGTEQYPFGPFAAYDNQQCGIKDAWEELVNVGCQELAYGGFPARWYSFPGRCAAGDCGGLCGCDQILGVDHCTYHYEDAGELDISELTGVPGDYSTFCATGGKEFDTSLDRGVGMHWWDNYSHSFTESAWRRINAVWDAFYYKYPHLPRRIDEVTCSDEWQR